MPYAITSDCIGCQICKKICPPDAIFGKKKELHTVNTNICIDCGACGRVCPVKAVENDFGLIATRIRKKDWERPVIDIDTCMSCGICIDTCPAGAIDQAVQKKGNLHAFPFLPDESICMGCGFCATDCPVSAIAMGPRKKKKQARKEA